MLLHGLVACVTLLTDMAVLSVPAGWSDEDRAAKRSELRACINAVVCKSAGTVFYYQGLHDVASVLLFVAGDGAATQMLDQLCNCQLKDCTRYVHCLKPRLSASQELVSDKQRPAGPHWMLFLSCSRC